jgi:hypothetical protein
MFNTPVVIHLSRLVTELGKRLETTDGVEEVEREVPCDEAAAEVILR